MKSKENFLVKNIFKPHRFRIIHGIKTALGCLIGLAIEKYFAWPSGQWVPITIMVVMSAQTHFGGAVRKAAMRFLGTLAGVATTITVLWLFGDNTTVIFSTVFVASIVFAYIASEHGDINYAGTLGGVTTILILGGQQVGIDIALQRGFYITVGIIIALLVSRFIFPIHARDRLRFHIAVTLRNLNSLYAAAIDIENRLNQKEHETSVLNSKITEDIAAQPRLVYEAVIGSREFATKQPIFMAILSSEQSLSHLINLIYLSLREATSPTLINQQLNKIMWLHNIISNNFNHLANCIDTIELPQNTLILSETLTKITQTAEELTKETKTYQLIVGHSFLFLIGELIKELKNMEKLILKANSKKQDNVV